MPPQHPAVDHAVAPPTSQTDGATSRSSARPEFAVGPAHAPDRYVIDQCVDVGGEGVVYRAHVASPGTRVPIAVKTIFDIPNAHPTVDDRAKALATLACIDHVGLVRIRECFVGGPLHERGTEPPRDRLVHLVMDWIEGRTTRDVVGEGRPQPAYELTRLRAVAAALDTLHSGRHTGGVVVVHRDVKPGNVVLPRSGGAVLVDCSAIAPAGVSAPGLGTPGYRAPEAEAGYYSPAADLFGLAGVFLHWLTGLDPAEGTEVDDVRPVLRSRGVPSSGIDRLRAARSSEPCHRPRGAVELAEALLPW